MYLQILENTDFGKIRVQTHNGEPWFVAKDVCSALGINNHKQASSKLNSKERGVI